MSKQVLKIIKKTLVPLMMFVSPYCQAGLNSNGLSGLPLVLLKSDLNVLSTMSMPSLELQKLTRERGTVGQWISSSNFSMIDRDGLGWCIADSKNTNTKRIVKEYVANLALDIIHDGVGACPTMRPLSGRVLQESKIPFEPYDYIDIGIIGDKSGVKFRLGDLENKSNFAGGVIGFINKAGWLQPTGDDLTDFFFRASSLMRVAQYSHADSNIMGLSKCISSLGIGFTCSKFTASPLAVQGLFLDYVASNCDDCTDSGRAFLRIMSADLLYRVITVPQYRVLAERNFLLSGDDGRWVKLLDDVSKLRNASYGYVNM